MAIRFPMTPAGKERLLQDVDRIKRELPLIAVAIGEASGKPLQLKKGERSYLMPLDDHSYVAHPVDITALVRTALMELQAWEPAAPAVQFAQPTVWRSGCH